MNARRGSVLLEILLSIALFAVASAFTLLALRNALDGTRRASLRLAAIDLAATRMAELECGLDASREPPASDSDGLRVAVETEPTGWPGLVLAEVRVTAPTDDGRGERTVYALRQLVPTPRRAPRRVRSAAARPRRVPRGLSLFEILVSIVLFGLLVFALSSFLSDARRIRSRVAADVGRNLAVAAVIGELSEALATCVADDGGRGVRGDANSLAVAFAGVPAWRLGGGEPARALLPVDTFAIRFAADDGRIELGREGGESTRPEVAFEAVRFRYLDGTEWLDEFDSVALDRLPRAVEISLWFPRPAGPSTLERPEFDDAPAWPDRPPDRRRTIAVPDAPGGELP